MQNVLFAFYKTFKYCHLLSYLKEIPSTSKDSTNKTCHIDNHQFTQHDVAIVIIYNQICDFCLSHYIEYFTSDRES